MAGNYYSPEGSPYRFQSATPSPRWYGAEAFVRPQDWPARPHTRAAHYRTPSAGDFFSGQGYVSPRFTSSGQYATAAAAATANVSSPWTTRKQSFSGGAGATSSQRNKRERERARRNSYSHHRASDSYGESDEDEYIKVDGVTYIIPGMSKAKRAPYSTEHVYVERDYGCGLGTDYRYYSQGAHTHEAAYQTPPRGYTPRRGSMSGGHADFADFSKRAGANISRSQTVRPGSSHKKPTPPQAKVRVATVKDAERFRIPAGYSLKNWDPSEEPILLLGSVFDANSLGKWIYDWTVYHHGAGNPIPDMAGDLWLLLIKLAGKVKKAEDIAPRIRAQDNKDMVEDFIDGGDRLTDKLRKLLKTCESPMLKAAQKTGGSLGKDAGVEFVRTLFGRDRELERTERFMQSVRVWNMRFDKNCKAILDNPTI